MSNYKSLKFLLTGLFLLAGIGLKAQEFSVNDFTVTQGGTADVEICLTCEAEAWGGFQFDLVLPEGLHVVEDEYGLWYEVTDRLTYKTRKTEEFDVLGALQENGRYRIVVGNPAQKSLQGTEGALMTIRMTADKTMAVGTYPIGFEEIVLSDPQGASGIEPEPIENGGMVEVKRETVELDENSTEMPTNANGVDVYMKRTINAGNWSTIVLPFSMTGEQVKSVFGDDVLFIDFNGYEPKKDGDKTTDITVFFKSVDTDKGIEANHPYVMKVSATVTEWTLEDVDVTVDEQPKVTAVERTETQWSELVGTYLAQTDVPATCLVLNKNLFWYSMGKTKMKGYRAYFDFSDVLADIEDAQSTNIRFVIDGETTDISNLPDYKKNEVDSYDLSGRKINLEKAGKGVYVVGGKKVLIK